MSTGAVPTRGTNPAVSASTVAALAGDIPDGDLLVLLAAYEGIHAVHPRLIVPAGASVPSLVLELGLRAHLDITPADARVFATLDPRVATPVTLMLAGMSQAWDLRDKAFARLSEDDLTYLRASGHEHRTNDAHAEALMAQVDKAALVNGAILLLDTAEGLVIPALQTAVTAGAWPPLAIADPAGVLRLGSPGDDFESLDRILQIDPTGNDIYTNNAGGTTLTTGPTHAGSPIALSIDLNGNDQYQKRRNSPKLGGSEAGIGILLDLTGNDSYVCSLDCLGGTLSGIGYMRDQSGNDKYDTGEGIGSAGFGFIGVMREDAGNDSYLAGGFAMGSAEARGSMGLHWDRTGTDAHARLGGGIRQRCLDPRGSIYRAAFSVGKNTENRYAWIRRQRPPNPFARMRYGVGSWTTGGTRRHPPEPVAFC